MTRLERHLDLINSTRPEGSNTVALLDNPDLLDAKLVEEIGELIATGADIPAETADLLYFALVKSVAAGISFDEIARIIDQRERAVTRRPMKTKEG